MTTNRRLDEPPNEGRALRRHDSAGAVPLKATAVGAAVTAVVTVIVTALLGQLGIGSESQLPGEPTPTTAPPSPSPAPPPDSLLVVSDPPDASVTLDWREVGETPVILRAYMPAELLVLTRPGYVAQSRLVENIPTDRVDFFLERDTSSRANGTIVSMSRGADASLVGEIRGALQEMGYVTRGEPPELAAARRAAGGSLPPAMMSWARARWRARVLLQVEENRQTRDLGRQSLGEPLQDALMETYRTDLTLIVTVFDLYARTVLGTARGTGTGSGLDETRAIQRARERALPGLSGDLAHLMSRLENE